MTKWIVIALIIVLLWCYYNYSAKPNLVSRSTQTDNTETCRQNMDKIKEGTRQAGEELKELKEETSSSSSSRPPRLQFMSEEELRIFFEKLKAESELDIEELKKLTPPTHEEVKRAIERLKKKNEESKSDDPHLNKK